MAKTLKNILISLFGALAMLFAGTVFAACGVDYSKIQLVSDKEVVELEVGQSATVTFTIEGFQSGFSNQVQPNTVASGQSSIFSASQPRYLSDDRFSVEVVALAGGVGQLSMRTLEGNKECNVQVVVKQYSHSLSVNDGLLYLSNKTPFVPNSGMFTFDAHTTEKALSYYYVVPQTEEENLSALMLKDFDPQTLKATFSDGRATSVDIVRDVLRFDTATLDDEKGLCLAFAGQETEIGKGENSFSLLTIYAASINNADYETILGNVSTVHVLPDLNVSVTGGYLFPDNKVYHLDENKQFQEGFGLLRFDESGKLLDDVKIVPNNTEMVQYLLRVEMLETDETADVKVEISKDNEEVVVDFADYATTDVGNFKYIKISQNSLRQASTNLKINIFYALAQQVNDESVKVEKEIEIKTQIAPTAITVNGKTQPDDLKLYYVHTSPSYGWEDLLVDVVSNFETSPNFDGIYFTFESCIDMMYDGATVRSGRSRLFTAEDLQKPFRVRAVGGIEQQTKIQVHLVSDILQDESITPVEIDCTILEGARRIRLNGIFEPLYVDFDNGTVNFVDLNNVGTSILYANDEFKRVEVRHSGGVDILNFETSLSNPYVLADDKYFLNVKATPKAVGNGRYEFILDNGTSAEVNFSCVRSLTGESTFVRMADSGDNSYSYATTNRTEGSVFDNVLNIEIQNSSEKGVISYGKSASFEILSNATSIDDPRMDTAMFVTFPIRNGNIFKVTTLANGDTQISFVLKGLQVQNFVRKDVNLTVFVNVSSYSLVDEFYLKNGENYALSNTIYYGNSAAQDTSVTFTPQVSSAVSNNFLKYQFVEEGIETIYDGAVETQNGYSFTVNTSNFSSLVKQDLLHESFDTKFIYFYAFKSDGTLLDNQTQMQATVKYAYKKDGRGTWIFEDADTKQIAIRMTNGLMFFAEDFLFEKTNELGEAYEAYSVAFSNNFEIGSKGEFDIKTFTFKYKLETDRPPECVISANLSQRNLTKRYDAHIYPTLYIPAESVSLLSSMTKIDFNNEKLTAKISVSLYPSNCTSKDIRAEFVTADGCPYRFMDILEPDTSRKDSGIFTLTLSCERFFNNPDSTLPSTEKPIGESVIEITKNLSGILYIYPREWGTNYADIGAENQPIKVEVRYRNGSLANPYVLETVEDVLAINSNEATLRSHYEIGTSISMQSVTSGALPIGIVDGKLVGFSGSITGTNSQAGISGISVSDNNFSATVDGVKYAGLFAKINAPTYKPGTTQIENMPTLENLTVSGKLNLNPTSKTYASLLAALNFGQITNVGVKVSKSSISAKGMASADLYFGAAAAVNYGNILQDFTKYDGTTLSSSRDFSGQTPKNMAFYETTSDSATLVIEAGEGSVFAGGVVGANNGQISRILPIASYKLYNYSGYSAYVSISVAGHSDSTDGSGASRFGLYAGGIAGTSSNDISGSFVPNNQNANSADIVLKNLLVGGQISTINATGYNDSVGGIVGYVSNKSNPQNSNQKVTVLQNTSRVFLRGGNFVGGIAGFDDFATSSGTVLVDFGKENKIEAVDDGRNSIMAASIIRKNSETLKTYLENISSNPDEVDENKVQQRNAFFAVGNAFANNKNYVGLEDEFSALTYVQRQKIETLSETFLSPESGTTGEYYGDLLLVSLQEETGNFRLDASRFFKFSKVEVELEENDFAMTLADGSKDLDVFFMFYFHVSSDLSNEKGALAQDDVESLNNFLPNSQFYPFKMQSQDVAINIASSNILSVDANGALTAKGTGHAVINLSSILNVMASRSIHIFVVNFFDKNLEENSSIFFSTPTLGGTNLADGSDLPILGNSYSHVFVVPTYSLADGKTSDGESFVISRNGILTYQNVAYRLSPNSQLSIEEEQFVKFDISQINTREDGSHYVLQDSKEVEVDEFGYALDEDGERIKIQENKFSSAQINQQNIVFFKSQSGASEGDEDLYQLVPVLKIDIDGQTYYYHLGQSRINLTLKYHEAATAISTIRTSHTFQTNGHFSDAVSITTTNPNEMLFYDIEGRNGTGYVQQRLDNTKLTEGDWKSYMATKDDDLFIFDFTRTATESGFVFDFNCRINTESERYKNRYVAGKSIFGEYIFTFFTSQLHENGAVQCTMRVQLDEALLSYVNVENYSNFNDISTPDNVVVPTQRGLLEIALDPVDAVFEQFYVSNNAINSNAGAGQAIFSFAYQKQTNFGVEYVTLEDFGHYENGAFTFSNEEMKKRLAGLALDESKGEKLIANNKIYISYFLPSNRVEDDIPVAFDVKVTYGNRGQEVYETTLPLRTKLGSFARLQFENKEKIGDAYFLARGLSYNMILDSRGFSENQISFSFSNPDYVSIEKQNGRYLLKVTPNDILYSDDIGYELTITTHAEKIVDNVKVSTDDVMKVYLMEYVLQYQYMSGVNEDLVRGMYDGVISTAIGNPYRLEFAIRDFLEYDAGNLIISREVDDFVAQMTQNLQWKVWEDGQETLLEQGKRIRSKADYYQISSLTVTPTKIYNPAQNIYHFSVGGNYEMSKGSYAFAEYVSQNTNVLYTEFAFDVHEQSTQESPIPIEDYDDLLNMHEGQWYILLNDITLPSMEYAAQHNMQQFMPISTQIAGLDGNSFAFKFAGTYNFDGLTEVGLFDNVAENTILRNVTIQLATDVRFNMNVETFNVGLLAANNSGIISNASVEVAGTAALTVEDSVTAASSYVAALVAQNNGYITNSRSRANIFSKVNLSGFVGVNGGHIASSFFRGGTLVNNTNTTNEFTAGFVVRNSGQIYTSYVSGDDDNNEKSAFYRGESDFIQASGNISGFAYTNSGQIYDSYSNIHLIQSGFFASGFVFENTGRVERCFSTSVLESEQTRNYGFVRTNNIQASGAGVENGIFECFYLEDELEDGTKINKNIGSIATDDGVTNVKPIKLSAFNCMDAEGNVNELFENFVISRGRDINSVWFFNNNADDNVDFEKHKFNVGRIELVSANIQARSHRKFDHTENVVDAETGATYVRYVYVYHEDSAALGSEFNPILISSAEEFENFILQENNRAGFNSRHYRLINDISYDEYLSNSSTFATKFVGYLEGNFMTVRGQNLVSTDNVTSAGLFAQVGSSKISGAIGTVMNFTFLPGTVDFAKAGAVGAITGILDGGQILNVDVQGEGTVVGNNIVGGAIGMTLGQFKVQNVFSQLSAKARKSDVADENLFVENSVETTMANLSFAGSLIGAASGRGKIINCVLDDSVVSVIANKAGLLFGLVDENVSVTKVRLLIDKQMFLNGFAYAGLVVGESKGHFEDVVVENDGGILSFENFGQSRFGEVSIGGFAGLVSGGSLDNITMNQSISVSTISTSNGVEFFGGIAGKISSVQKISNITLKDISLVGFANVGAVAGSLEGGETYFENIAVSNVTLSALGLGQKQIGVAGLVGFVQAGSLINLTFTENPDKFAEKSNVLDVNIVVETYNYGIGVNSGVTVSVGAAVGCDSTGGSHRFEDVTANLNNVSCKVTDLSKNYGMASGTLKYDADGAAPAGDDVFDARISSANGCECSGNISFSVSKDEEKLPICKLVVNLLAN